MLKIMIKCEIKEHKFIYPPASKASKGVYWNQAQKKFHSPVYWVPLGVCHFVTLWICNSEAIKNLSKLAPFAGVYWTSRVETEVSIWQSCTFN